MSLIQEKVNQAIEILKEQQHRYVADLRPRDQRRARPRAGFSDRRK